MVKSPDAFRTIGEVAEWLDTPAHVLRFWESKFTQVKPVKRAGGRRYYRVEDMALLGGIKTLLHERGMTIKGAQRLLREMGVKYVASLGPQPQAEGDAPVIDHVTAAAPAVKVAAQEPALIAESVAMPEDGLPYAEPANIPQEPANNPDSEAIIAPDDPLTTDPHAENQSDPEEEPAASLPSPQPIDAAAVVPEHPATRAPMNTLDPIAQPDVMLLSGTLSALIHSDRRHLTNRRARIIPIVARLATLRDRMALDHR